MNDTENAVREPLAKTYILLMGVGFVVFAAGLFAAPERIWSSWLVSVAMLVGLALSGPVLIAIVRLCAGTWADPLEPVARLTSRVLPVAAALAALTLFGLSSLYEWARVTPEEAGTHLSHKLGWLNTNGFAIRTVICFLIWGAGAPWMFKKSGRGRAGIFMILFAISFAVFSFDWLMSLEPLWFSTMFGVYCFSGLFLSGIAALVLVLLRFSALGRLSKPREELLHDLGKLMFAFSFFWGYIWFCQYMLIWYTNMPEETVWFASRMSGSWGTLSYLSLALNFLIPFLMLLPSPAKSNESVLIRVAFILLAGRWLDLYIIVTPKAFPEVPPLGLWELAPPIAALAAFFWFMSRRRSTALPAAA